ncbi:MAG: PD40 domain-containing protein [Anaerolineae bacterium]|nr:PD40 domain-containing protein [Anaerolineae bacterium]
MSKAISWLASIPMRRLFALVALGTVLVLCFALGRGTSASGDDARSPDVGLMYQGGPAPLQVTQTLAPSATPEPTPTPEPKCVVGDFVWLDKDLDGVQDPDEMGVPGVVVNLYDGDGHKIGTKTTGSGSYDRGLYYFENLDPGLYYIEFVLPPGYHFVPKDQGGDEYLDSDADPTTGRTIIFRLDPGISGSCHVSWWDAGLHRSPLLEGYKFWDQNDNGAWDEGEPRVGGVHIIVRDSVGAIVFETDTIDAPGTVNHGKWSATLDVLSGIYTVEEVVPEGWRQTYPTTDNGTYRIQTYGDGTYTLLTTPPNWTGDLSFGNYKYSPCWVCPEWVVFQTDRANKNVDVWRMRFDGTNPERLTHDLAQDAMPIWDFEGQRIAFASNRDGDWEIYRMNGDGSGETNVTKWPLAVDGISLSQDMAPSWDCYEIVFQSDRDLNWEIYKTDPGGVIQTRLTNHPASDEAPNWHPYSTQIAFQTDRDGNTEIYVMDPDGSNLVRITNHPAEDRHPSWSTDGKWIFFDSDREDDRFDVYKINVETRQVIRLTDDPLRTPDGDTDTDPDAMPYCEYVFFESNRVLSPDVFRMLEDGTQELNIILGDMGPSYWIDYLDDLPGPWYDLYLPLVLRNYNAYR